MAILENTLLKEIVAFSAHAHRVYTTQTIYKLTLNSTSVLG